MSVKELVLIPKQKYEHLSEKQSPTNTVSVQTQTDAEEDERQTANNSNNNNKTQTTTPSVNPTESVNTLQAVRSPSWNIIPGIRSKRKARKTVKWIPY